MPVPWSDAVPRWQSRGFVSSNEEAAYMQALQTKPLSPDMLDDYMFNQPKVAVDALFGGTGTLAPSPAPAPFYSPETDLIDRAPQDYLKREGELVAGQKALTPTPTDAEAVATAAQIMQRPRTPTGDQAITWWGDLATPKPNESPLITALRPQILMDSAGTTERDLAAQKDPSLKPGWLEYLTTDKTYLNQQGLPDQPGTRNPLKEGGSPATVESGLGYFLRMLAAPVSGAAGAASDLLHGFGLASGEGDGIAERIRKGEGLAGAGRDLTLSQTQAVPPEPTTGQASIEWQRWNNDQRPVDVKGPEPVGAPTPEWEAWKKEADSINNTRAQASEAGFLLGLVGDFMVPIDLGAAGTAKKAVSAVQAERAVQALRVGEAPAYDALRQVLAATLIPSKVGQVIEAAGKESTTLGKIAEGAKALASELPDARLVAIERLASDSGAMRAANTWAQATEEAVASGRSVLAIHPKLEAKMLSTLERMGLPATTAEASAKLDNIKMLSGSPRNLAPKDITRAVYAEQMARALPHRAEEVVRIGNVAVPPAILPELRQAIADSPAGRFSTQALESLRSSAARKPYFAYRPEQLKELAEYFDAHGVLDRAPPRFVEYLHPESFTEHSVDPFLTKPEWNAIVALTTEVEAQKLIGEGVVVPRARLLPATASAEEVGKAVREHELATRALTPPEIRTPAIVSSIQNALATWKNTNKIAPIKFANPILEEWVKQVMSRMGSVDEAIKARIRSNMKNPSFLLGEGSGGELFGTKPNPMSQAYAKEFVDTWAHVSGLSMNRDAHVMVTDILAGAYGSVLGVGTKLEGVDPNDIYSLVGALVDIRDTTLGKLPERVQGSRDLATYNNSVRLASLPAHYGKSLGEWVTPADLTLLRDNPGTLERWGLEGKDLGALHLRMMTVTPRFAATEAQQLLSILHVNRRAEDVAQDAIKELQSLVPNLSVNDATIQRVSTQMWGAIERALGKPIVDQEPALRRALATDFVQEIRHRISQTIMLPTPTAGTAAVRSPKDALFATTEVLKLELGKLDLIQGGSDTFKNLDIAYLQAELVKQADTYLQLVQHDLGGVITAQGGLDLVESLVEALKDHVLGKAEDVFQTGTYGKPMLATKALQRQAFLVLEDPAVRARLKGLGDFIGISNEVEHMPLPTSMYADMSVADIASGFSKMKDVRWGPTWMDTAVVRWTNGLGTNIRTSLWGLTRAGMLGGMYIPNIGYHMANIITAPAIIWQTVGGRAALGSLGAIFSREVAPGLRIPTLFNGEAAQVLKYYYGYLGGVNSLESLKPLIRTPSGVAYTARDLAKLIAREGISKSQATFELGSDIVKDLVKWSGQVVGPNGAKDVSVIRNHLRRYWDPRRSNLWNEVAQAFDNANRTSVLLYALKSGKTEQEAVQMARASLFDYGSLTDWERKYLSKNILFYSFLRHNVVTATEAILGNPSRAVHLLRLSQGLPEMLTADDPTHHLSASDMSDNKPFLTMLTDKNLQARYGVYGPTIPFADGLSQIVTLMAVFQPIADQTQTGPERTGEVIKNALVQVAGHQGPYGQAAVNILTGKSYAFSEEHTLGTYIDPKLLYWLSLNPSAWAAFCSLFKLDIVPRDQVGTTRYSAFNGEYYMIAKGSVHTIQAWTLLQAAATVLGFNRAFSQLAPALRGESPEPNRQTGLNLEVPHDVQSTEAIDPHLSPWLYETLRDIGAISVVREPKDLQQTQETNAVYDSFGYPEDPN